MVKRQKLRHPQLDTPPPTVTSASDIQGVIRLVRFVIKCLQLLRTAEMACICITRFYNVLVILVSAALCPCLLEFGSLWRVQWS